MTETIAAISTAPGIGGIGVIRISGDQSFAIAERIFRKKGKSSRLSPRSHVLFLGNIIRPQNQEILDEVLICYMKSPATYTREDMVEVQAHGGRVVLREILELILDEGARLAEPGEFTKKAFLNGRIDLSQAEAVIDVISAKTAKGLLLAERQLHGRLRENITAIRVRLQAVHAEMEAGIDFFEDVQGEVDTEEWRRKLLTGVITPLTEIRKTFHAGQIFREGVKTVVVGRPNVGKSSLMNALLRKDRAIVTEIPGTTRDILEESINLEGVPFVISDSAGLRQTENPVELIGIRKTWDSIQASDMVLFLLDASAGVERGDLEIFDRIKEKEPVVIINKIDLAGEPIDILLPDAMRGFEQKEISAKTGFGMDELEKRMVEIALGESAGAADMDASLNLRQKKSIDSALDFLQHAMDRLQDGYSEDFIAMDVAVAIEKLDEVLGAHAREDVLEEIFRRFCIGK